ncbi:MAG: FAD-dependent oxidoreductase [Rhodospirillales bacterium]|nr:FAD-dependent oxidoreductase [Rhodospirillales bacterium]
MGPAEDNTVAAEVVVIGGGGSGLAAAIEAKRFCANVVLLEKNWALGGTTALSIGSITATCTAYQRKAGIVDSPDEHYRDMPLFHGRHEGLDNPELRRILTENVPETVAWLGELGVEFFGPMPEPPHKKPRMHNVLPNSRAYIYHLAKRARGLGVDIRLGCRVERFIEERGRIVGVEAAVDGRRTRIEARRGIVLASGDYSASAELKGEFAGPDVARVEALNPTNTGDGQRLGRALGARVLNGHVMLGPEIRFQKPPGKALVQELPPYRWLARFMRLSMDAMPAWLLRPFIMMFLTTALAPSPNLFREGAILVNREGRRFTEETKSPAFDVPKQPDGVAYILFDRRIAEKFSAWPHFISTAPGIAYAYLADYRRNRRDIYNEAPTLEALAQKLGMAPATLALPALTEPPFYALGPVKSWIMFTDGGLTVTSRLEVKREDGSVVQGLYAAGSAGQGGLLLEGHGHHLGWAFTSGRIAGRNAALNTPVPVGNE